MLLVGKEGSGKEGGIHATRDNSRTVEPQAPTPRYRSAGHAVRYPKVVRGLRPRSPAGLCPAPTRELAPWTHIHVRRVASWFWRVSRLTLIPT